MKLLRRKPGFLAFWRDLTSEPDWHYQELPPLLLPELRPLHLPVGSEWELERAIWLWLRRPKPRFYESPSALVVEVLCLFAAVTIALLDWPPCSISVITAEAIIVLFGFAFEIGGVLHQVRVGRWRREYEVGVNRLIRTAHPAL